MPIDRSSAIVIDRDWHVICDDCDCHRDSTLKQGRSKGEKRTPASDGTGAEESPAEESRDPC